jgi:hypothetical protein
MNGDVSILNSLIDGDIFSIFVIVVFVNLRPTLQYSAKASSG